MKHRRLGGTDLVVSEVGFALEALSAPGPVVVQESQAARLLQESRDLGVTFFDTADRDGMGYGEELLGTALYSHRHDIVIATKVGYDFYTPILDPTRDRRDFPQSFAPSYLRSACERSLRRLRRDYIDLYQLHHPTPEALVDDDLWELLETLVQEGKVRYVGVALGPGPEAVEAGLIALGKAPVAALLLSYNMLRLSPGRGLFPAAADRDVGVVVRDPHASGLLDDFSSQESDSQEAADPRSQTDRSSLDQRLRNMQFLVEHHPEADLYELALAFCLARRAVASALPEFRDLERVQRAVAAADVEAPCPECQKQLVELYDAESSAEIHNSAME